MTNETAIATGLMKMSKYRVCLMVPRVMEIDAGTPIHAAQAAVSAAMQMFGASRTVSDKDESVPHILSSQRPEMRYAYTGEGSFLLPKVLYVDPVKENGE